MNYNRAIDEMNKRITERLLDIYNNKENIEEFDSCDERGYEYGYFCEDFEE